MAVSSLTKMSVPVDANPGNQGLLMPKLKYRFRVTMLGFGTDTGSVVDLTKQVVSVARPNLTFEEISLPIYNSTIKLAGRHTWADIACSVRDDASGNVGKLVGQQFQKQLDFLEQASASAGIDYKFTTVIEVLDGGNGAVTPNILEQWQLYGCYLKGADYGELNYGTNEAVTVNLTIAYDNAMQMEGEQVPNQGPTNAIGGAIAQAIGTNRTTGAATGASTQA